MNITNAKEFNNASFLERKFFVNKHGYSFTRLAGIFKCDVSTISRLMRNDPLLKKKFHSVAHSKTLQKLYQKEQEQLKQVA